jgi:hypothetical protein
MNRGGKKKERGRENPNKKGGRKRERNKMEN